MDVSKEKEEDQRKYVRLKNVAPVEYTIVRLQGDLPGIDWQKGHTHNVSKEGLCLETEEISESTISFLGKENIYLDLRIHLPLHTKPVKAVGEIAWYERVSGEHSYRIGLKYRSIAPENIKKILRLAEFKLLIPKASIIIALITALILLVAVIAR